MPPSRINQPLMASQLKDPNRNEAFGSVVYCTRDIFIPFDKLRGIFVVRINQQRMLCADIWGHCRSPVFWIKQRKQVLLVRSIIAHVARKEEVAPFISQPEIPGGLQRYRPILPPSALWPKVLYHIMRPWILSFAISTLVVLGYPQCVLHFRGGIDMFLYLQRLILSPIRP